MDWNLRPDGTFPNPQSQESELLLQKRQKMTTNSAVKVLFTVRNSGNCVLLLHCYKTGILTVMLLPTKKVFSPLTLVKNISLTHKKSGTNTQEEIFLNSAKESLLWQKDYLKKKKKKSFRKGFLTNRFQGQRNYSDTVLRESVCGGVIWCIDLATKYILSHKDNMRTVEKLLLFSVSFLMQFKRSQPLWCTSVPSVLLIQSSG